MADWMGTSQSLFTTIGASNHTSARVAYAWFVWEKGYKGETIVKWFN